MKNRLVSCTIVYCQKKSMLMSFYNSLHNTSLIQTLLWTTDMSPSETREPINM